MTHEPGQPDPAARLDAALGDRYAIESELGAGGMATVYAARDLRHERTVAVKVLRPELAAVVGAERFLAEIRTTAALQHPHILPLFDSGEAEGLLYYVMPLVEGESLRARLDRERQLPVDEAVGIARAVAGALDHAHRHGVIHRDIKPANVLLQDGEPVVADFGIALAVSAAGGGRLTETGLSLGTPHYMSPEQATGERDPGPASDVYSLGCVLYEMLVGEPPFTGATAQAVLARILTAEPSRVNAERRTVPPHVDAAVARALEKLPADRFGSAEAFAGALADPGFRHEPAPAPAAGPGAGAASSAIRTAPGSVRGAAVASPARPSLAHRAAWPAVAAVAVVASLLLLARDFRGRSGPEASVPVTRVVLDAPELSDRSQIAISPDGSMIAYSVMDDRGNWRIYVRRADELEARPLPGTEGGDYPAFSPDGRWIAFSTLGRGVFRIPTRGGSAVSVAPATGGWTGMGWGEDGTLYYATGGEIRRVPAGGGAAETVAEAAAAFPDPLPGGEGVLYADWLEGELHVLDLGSGETRALEIEGSVPRYVPTGHVVFHRDGGLFAVPFDARRLRVTGAVVPVLDTVSAGGQLSPGRFAVGRNGTALYTVQRGGGLLSTPVVRHLDGREERLRLPRGRYLNPAISPDGRRLAYEEVGGGRLNVLVHDLVLGTTTPIAESAGGSLWTPEGDRIVYAQFTGSSAPVVSRAADASGPLDTLVRAEPGTILLPGAFSPDGTQLLLNFYRIETGASDLVVAVADGAGGWRVEPYLHADWNESFPDVSPDGRWAAYVSDEEGEDAVYVRAFPEPGPAVRVSAGRGAVPRWSPDGATLYYGAGDTLVAADVRTDPAFEVLRRRPVFVQRAAYDVHPDGDRFLLFKGGDGEEEGEEAAAAEAPRLVLVVNWLEELRERVGAASAGR